MTFALLIGYIVCLVHAYNAAIKDKKDPETAIIMALFAGTHIFLCYGGMLLGAFIIIGGIFV